MAIHEIVKLGNPVLRQPARKISRFDPPLLQLVAEMFETMHAAHGVGLAAPQIGRSMRLFVVELQDVETGAHHKVALANPKILEATGEQVGVDACLSIPGYYGVNVRRAHRVVVQGQDPRGRPVRLRAQGYFAWALQHEIDHLDGILYVDRLDRIGDLRVAHPAGPALEAVPVE